MGLRHHHVCVCMTTLILEGKPVSFGQDGNGTNAIKFRFLNLLTPVDILKNGRFCLCILL